MVIKRKSLIRFVTLLFVLASFYFFSPVFVSIPVLKALYTILLASIVLLSIPKISKVKIRSRMADPVILLVAAILLSIAVCYISWGQRPIITLTATLPYLSYLLFFYLKYNRVSTAYAEKVIYIVGLMNLGVYVIAFLAFPTMLFGRHSADEIQMDRGFARIIVGGLGFLYLLFFFSINKYIQLKSQKWLFLIVLCLVGIVMTLTRQTILSCIILGIWFILSHMSVVKRTLICGLIFCISIFVIPNLTFVNSLMDTTQKQAQSFDDDVRLLSADFYLLHLSPDLLTTLFGNGEPVIGKSEFGNFVENLQTNFGLFQSDIGFIGLYSKFGILAIIAWTLLFLRIFTARLDDDKKYIKYFFWMILFTGLTSSMPFNYNYIAAIVIAIYIADCQTSQTTQKLNNDGKT